MKKFFVTKKRKKKKRKTKQNKTKQNKTKQNKTKQNNDNNGDDDNNNNDSDLPPLGPLVAIIQQSFLQPQALKSDRIAANIGHKNDKKFLKEF